MNLKQLIARAENPLFDQKNPKKQAPKASSISTKDFTLSKIGTSKVNSGHTTKLSPSNQESSMRETISSNASNLSTATDRLKRILKKQPVQIKGAGFSETPFQRMLIEDEINKP